MSRSSARNAARGVPKRHIATPDLPVNEKKGSFTPNPPSPEPIVEKQDSDPLTEEPFDLPQQVGSECIYNALTHVNDLLSSLIFNESVIL